jgi:TolA-binding protein
MSLGLSVYAVAILGVMSFGQAMAQDTEAPSETPTGAVSQGDYSAALERVRARANEFRDDTRSLVERREAAARLSISQGYDALIEELSAEEKKNRNIAVTKFREFLSRNADHRYSDDVRFRLADLAWEQASLDWLSAHRDYDIIEEALVAEGRFDELPEEPELDLSETIGLYERVIERNRLLSKADRFEHLDGVYYMLAFAYKDESAIQRDEDSALALFQELIERCPDSEYVDTAHMFIGTMLFDRNNFTEAIAEYNVVIEKGVDGRHHADAMYYLAWSIYKMSLLPEEYQKALEVFDSLIERSNQLLVEEGRRSDFEPDAIRYIAHSFADISDITGESPVEVAERFFSTRNQKGYEAKAFAVLAEVLELYGRYEEAIEVYVRLQQEPWQFAPENPGYQVRIVQLHASGDSPDPDAAAAARMAITERFNERSSWWYANRNQPQALQEARKYIEGSLSSVAVEYHGIAAASGDRRDYLAAADQFRLYLDAFPLSDDYYGHEWLLAANLFGANEFERANAIAQSLSRTSGVHGYGDSALFLRLLISEKRMLSEYGPAEASPSVWGGRVQETRTLPSGTTVVVYKISDVHQEYMDVRDIVADHEVRSVESEWAYDAEKLRTTFKKNRAAYLYNVAQVLMEHRHFDDARARYMKVIEQYPERNEAAYAATAIIDSFNFEGDLENTRKYAKIYSRMQLGDTEDKSIAFANIEQAAAFKQAAGLAKAGDREAAALAYEDFYAEYPDSDIAPDAMFNAALNHEKSGGVGRSNEILEEFVNTYPNHERSKNLLFRIASNYESTFEISQAIRYYTDLVTRFPASQNAVAAYYNAAFLKTGVGDFFGAAQDFEMFADKFPDEPDVEEVFFRAGAQYALVSPVVEEDFYRRFLERFEQSGESGRVLLAHERLLNKAKDRGDDAAVERRTKALLARFGQYVSDGVVVSVRGRRAAALADQPRMLAQFELFSTGETTGDEASDGLLIKGKQDTLPAFIEEAKAYGESYGVFDSLALYRYLDGAASLYNADLIYSYDCPTNYTEEQCDAFMEIIYEQVYPLADTAQAYAIQRFLFVGELADKMGQHNIWVTKAADILNSLDPFTYPTEKLAEIATPVVVELPSVVPYKIQKVTPVPPPVVPTEDVLPSEQPQSPEVEDDTPEGEAPEPGSIWGAL